MAQYIRYNGKHSAIFYSDPSKESVAYRHISLLVHHPPARDAYLGGAFSMLVVGRATATTDVMPKIEMQACDTSANIPTTIISIIGGHTFLETALLYKGIRLAMALCCSPAPPWAFSCNAGSSATASSWSSS